MLANTEDLGNLSNVISSKQHEISMQLEKEIKYQTAKKAVITYPPQSQDHVFKRLRDSCYHSPDSKVHAPLSLRAKTDGIFKKKLKLNGRNRIGASMSKMDPFKYGTDQSSGFP